MATICSTGEKKNLGINRCVTMPQLPKQIITTPMGFEVTPLQAVDPTFWQTAITAGKATRIYVWPTVKSYENLSEESVYEVTPLSSEFVRSGLYIFRMFFNDGLCTHRAMFTHNGGNQRIWLLDINNNLLGTEKSNGNFAGLTVQLLNTEKLILSDGSVSTKTPVYIVLADSNEIDKAGIIFPAPFVPQLERLTDVELTIVDASATEVNVTVSNFCDGTEVMGLLTADFIFLDAAGDAQTFTAAASADGSSYILSGTGLETGTLTLRAPSLLTVKAYESVGPVAVTIA
jgi:hypothetical protein